MMTPRRRFLTALARRQPDRVPVWELIINPPTLTAWGASSFAEFADAEDLDGITVFEDTPVRPLSREEADELSARRQLPEPLAPETHVMDHWGCIWGKTDFGIPYPVTGPIQDADALRHWTPPDPDEDSLLHSLRAAVERFRGRRAVVFLTHDGFEFVHYLLGGLDRLMLAYLDSPRLVHQLAEIVIDYKIRLMQKAAAAGADAVVSGDDYAGRTGPLMSPSHFREFVFPYLRRSVAAAHALGVPYIKHTDGNVWPLLEMMLEAGIDALDPIEPIAGMDIGEVKQHYGDRIALVGNVDCTELLPHGTPEQVREAVKETLAKAAPGGGYILASSNSIHPAVRPENYRAMVDAAREWGRYPLDPEMVRNYRTKNYMEQWMDRVGP